MTECPGCGLRSAEPGVPLDRPLNASAACWGLHAELVGFELLHAVPLGRLHQLTVDAYGAAHPGPPTSRRYLAYSLVGLCVALERGWTGDEVRELHARMGPPQPAWPAFLPPQQRAAITVADVVEAGARAGSTDGHERLVVAWASDVWSALAERRADVRWLAEGVLEDPPPRPR